MREPLLIEIGSEEIPARMIEGAASELAARIVDILDQARLPHGPAVAWGGTRRLTVRVEEVEARQEDREEIVLGPPASVAFGPEGQPSGAAVGFARKQGIDPSRLERIETPKGSYSGYRRQVEGKTAGEILAGGFEPAAAGMSFPKTMRWGTGEHRWVRPVHWLLALHGEEVLPLVLFGIRASGDSRGHRFLAPGPVTIPHPDRYRDALRSVFVLADPSERTAELKARLHLEAGLAGGEIVEDPSLLREVADLVEWPGVAVGRFDPEYLELPREVLVTTLRHHQKSFSVEANGQLLPIFLSVANTDRDPAGHVRRGNEWVVGGRLEDARFFWKQDRERSLASRGGELANVVFHEKLGTYAAKAERTEQLARRVALFLDLPEAERERVCRAARLAKVDLVTGLVGEFPELQGIVGGLLLRAEGEDDGVAQAIYEQYLPAGADDPIPSTLLGGVLAMADRLDTVGEFLRIGVIPTGSRDPFGLRRALNGVLRIVAERDWPFSLLALKEMLGLEGDGWVFLKERTANFLRERGFTVNEVHAVNRPRIEPEGFAAWPLGRTLDRLAAVRTFRDRPDFMILVDLTKRVDNILAKAPEVLSAASVARPADRHVETEPAALELGRIHAALEPEIEALSRSGDFQGVADRLAGLVAPVAAFFDTVLVLDPNRPDASASRLDLLMRLRGSLTHHFDIRELAGQADRRG